LKDLVRTALVLIFYFFLPSLREPAKVSKYWAKTILASFQSANSHTFVKEMVFKGDFHKPIIKFNFSHEKLKYFYLLAMLM
jgi:hypothetical protein